MPGRGEGWNEPSEGGLGCMAVVAAGPLMNFLLAFLVAVLIFLIWPVTTGVIPAIDTVVEDTPAMAAMSLIVYTFLTGYLPLNCHVRKVPVTISVTFSAVDYHNPGVSSIPADFFSSY